MKNSGYIYRGKESPNLIAEDLSVLEKGNHPRGMSKDVTQEQYRVVYEMYHF
jgi:hypothetical protein